MEKDALILNSEPKAVSPLSPQLRARLDDIETGRAPIYGRHYKMRSHSCLETPDEESARALVDMKRSKFFTVEADMTPCALNPVGIGRRELYGSLPFLSLYGMGHKEHVLHDVINEATRKNVESTELEKSLIDIDIDEILITVPMALAVVVAMISQFLSGYNTSVMNAPYNVVFHNHTTLQWSIAVSAYALGGCFGSIMGGFLSNKNGRRGTMMLNIWIYLAGGCIMTFAINMYYIIFARLIIGLASGISSVIVPIYLGEIAPPTLRGTLGTCTQFALVMGILFNNILAIPLSTKHLWRYLFLITPLLSILQLSFSTFLLESPRWLLSKDRHSLKARVNIKKLRGFRDDEDVENEIGNYLYAAKKHKAGSNSAHSRLAIVRLFYAKDIHRLLISVTILHLIQQFSGINAIFYYSTILFNNFMKYPIYGTLSVSIMNVAATYIALKLMDTTERRTLLIFSLLGMLISLIFILLSLLNIINNIITLIAVITFVLFYGIGLGPIPWLIVVEMFDMKYSSTVMSIASMLNWASTVIVGLCYPFLQESFGPWAFLPFMIIVFLGLLFTIFYLPETHEKTYDEIYKDITSQYIIPSQINTTNYYVQDYNSINENTSSNETSYNNLSREESKNMF